MAHNIPHEHVHLLAHLEEDAVVAVTELTQLLIDEKRQEQVKYTIALTHYDRPHAT